MDTPANRSNLTAGEAGIEECAIERDRLTTHELFAPPLDSTKELFRPRKGLFATIQLLGSSCLSENWANALFRPDSEKECAVAL